MREERRRYQRVTLPNPIRGEIGPIRVYVVDIAINGVRVVHQDDLGGPGAPCTLRFEAPAGRIALDCEIVRTALHRPPKQGGDRATYHSGLQVVAARNMSDRVLREMISSYVERALDEQRANARGIPATAAMSFQTGKGMEFIRVELFAGRWRRSATREPQQPMNGFTISASEPEPNIRTLCDAYEAADTEGRRLIRIMAELSTSKAEGIPTRRYDP